MLLFIFNKKVEIERNDMCVGPIWGQYEAEKKIRKYMYENNIPDQGWNWDGHWYSERGTSYAIFWRIKNLLQPKTSESSPI